MLPTRATVPAATASLKSFLTFVLRSVCVRKSAVADASATGEVRWGHRDRFKPAVGERDIPERTSWAEVGSPFTFAPSTVLPRPQSAGLRDPPAARQPATRSRVQDVAPAEAKLDLDAEVAAAEAASERVAIA